MEREQEFVLVEITRDERKNEDGRYDIRSRTLLKQELEPAKFDLAAVIQAINFPEQLDLRRLAAQCASTPRILEPSINRNRAIEQVYTKLRAEFAGMDVDKADELARNLVDAAWELIPNG